MIKSEVFESNLKEIFDRYENYNINGKILPIDAFFIYRILLNRNPGPEEINNMVKLDVPFRDYLESILSSEEFSKTTRFFPQNHEFMVELEDFKFYFNTSDREMGVRMALKQYECEVVQLLEKIIKKGDRCIDAGAQTGFYTLHMANIVGSGGKVYSFEPNPKTYRLLEKNVAVNDYNSRVECHNLGLSDQDRTIVASEVSNMYIVGSNIEGGKETRMKVVCGDNFINDKINFIKIDIEGSEPAAISGMAKLIRDSKPIIFSEINEYWLRDRAKSSSQEYVNKLKSYGYDIYDVKSIFRENWTKIDNIQMNILDTMDVICLPSGTSWV